MFSWWCVLLAVKFSISNINLQFTLRGQTWSQSADQQQSDQSIIQQQTQSSHGSFVSHGPIMSRLQTRRWQMDHCDHCPLMLHHQCQCPGSLQARLCAQLFYTTTPTQMGLVHQTKAETQLTLQLACLFVSELFEVE